MKRLMKPRMREAARYAAPAAVVPTAEPSAASLQRRADTARDAANWPAAAALYRESLERDRRIPLLVQRGHMLKAAGLFGEAQRSYRAAMEAAESDPEPVVQLAILAKIEARFDEAERLFRNALALGYRDRGFVEREIEFLRKTADRGLEARDAAEDFVIYLSCAVKAVPNDVPAELKSFFGAANYSYAILLDLFRAAIEAAGLPYRMISHPEYLPDVTKLERTRVLHLGFYPPDGPRFVKGAHNITCVAWEFERLPTADERRSYHAFADAASLLSRSQEVWACSEFGAEAIRRSGVARVKAVSAPIRVPSTVARSARPGPQVLRRTASKLDRVGWAPLAIWPASQAQLSRQSEAQRRPLLNWLMSIDNDVEPIIFYSVFNVHDYRKQIKPLIEAFVRFAQRHDEAFLLLKVSCIDADRLDINSMLMMEQIGDAGEMTAALVSRRILMTTDALSKAEMDTLSDMSSYYVSTAHAEGQNLPLIEAMARGVVPISVDHTAMAEYIAPENAIVIPSRLSRMRMRLILRYGMADVSTYYVDRLAVLQALERATALSDADYAALSRAATATVASRFAPDRMLALLQEAGGRRSTLAGNTMADSDRRAREAV